MIIRAVIASLLLLAGAVTFGLSIAGVFRFKYVLNRLHASAIADTIGTMFISLGLIVLRGFSLASVKLIIIVIALWVTGPVCTNRIASAEVSSDKAYKKQVREK